MMENPKDFHHDDLLERAVDAVLRDPIPGDLSPEQVAQLVAVVRQAADRPYPITLMERIRNMRPMTKIAVAASVLIVLVGLLSWLVPGSGVAVAFADVAEAINGIHSATWKTTSVVEMTGPEKKTVTYKQIGMFLAPSHERTETTADGAEPQGINIVDGQKDKAIALVPATKTAMVINVKNLPAEEESFWQDFPGLARTRCQRPKRQGRQSGAAWRKNHRRPPGRRLSYSTGSHRCQDMGGPENAAAHPR